MKKTLLLGILLSAVLFSGCQKNTTVETTTETPTENKTFTQSAYALLENAMNNNESLTCTITDKTAGTTMEYQLQGKEKFRMENIIPDTENPGEMGYVLRNGDYFYTWTTPKNEGVMMAIPDEETLKDKYETIPDLSSDEKIREYEQNYTINCQPSTFPADFFTPPTDIKFQDMSKLMDSVLNEQGGGLSPEQKMQMEEALKKMNR